MKYNVSCERIRYSMILWYCLRFGFATLGNTRRIPMATAKINIGQRR